MPLVPAFSQQQFRLAAEDKYGVAPAGTAFRRINSLRMMLEPTFETEQFTPQGAQVPTISVLNDDYTEGEGEGKADYEAVVYPLASLLGDAAISTPGGGVNSRNWDFTWDGQTPYTPRSYAVQVGHAGDAEQTLGFLFNELGLSGARDGMDFDCAGFGRALSHGVTMGGATNEVQSVSITGSPAGGTFTLSFRGRTTATIAYNATAAAVQSALELLDTIGPGNVTCTGGPLPGSAVTVTFRGSLGGVDVPQMTTANALTGGTSPASAVATTTPGADTVTNITASPAFPLHFNVYGDDTWAGLGTTQWKHVYDLDFGFGEKFERTRPINRSMDTDSYVEMADQEHELTLAFAVDATQKGLIDRIRAGGMKFIRIESQGPIIEGAIPYLFRLDLACFIQEAAPGDELDSIYTREFTFRVGRDTTSGNAIAARVTNTRTAL